MQHALRAYTPAEQKGLKAAAQSFRVNPAFGTAEAIQQLGVGEALVSTLDEKGAPTIVQKTLVRPPVSRLGPVLPQERSEVMSRSPVKGIYDQTVDRDSAFERLRARTTSDAATKRDAEEASAQARTDASARRAQPRVSNRESVGEAFAKSLARPEHSNPYTDELFRIPWRKVKTTTICSSAFPIS